MMKPSNAECAVGAVHTASAINQDAENAARQVVKIMPARLKSADGINRQLEIALVMVRQLIVFHRHNHRRLAIRRQTDTSFKMTSA